MSSFKRVAWGIVGVVFSLLGLVMLPLPGPGFPILALGVLILVSVKAPYVEPAFRKSVDWLENKTGMEIHYRIHKIGKWLKYLGLKMKWKWKKIPRQTRDKNKK